MRPEIWASARGLGKGSPGEAEKMEILTEEDPAFMERMILDMVEGRDLGFVVWNLLCKGSKVRRFEDPQWMIEMGNKYLVRYLVCELVDFLEMYELNLQSTSFLEPVPGTQFSILMKPIERNHINI